MFVSGPDNEIVPGVATSWVVSEDRLTYTFFLRDDALWSNGERVTAGDFVFAWRRLVDPVTASPNALFLDSIENVGDVVAGREKPVSIGVRAASEESLVVSLERPTPYFLQLLAAPAALPLSESFLSQEERAPFLPGTYLSNGAYTLTSWTPGASIALTRNRHYADRASVYFERVVYQFLDDDRQTTLFRAGQLDITSSVASPMIELLREERPTELRISQFLGTYYYGFNLSDPLFRDNRNLRQALSMAIDREVIVNKITRRGEEPAYGWVPNDMPGYRATRLGFSELTREERENRARELLVDSGFDVQKPIRLLYNSSELHARIAVSIQSMWKRVLGIDVILVNEEFRVMLSNIMAKNGTQVFRLSWTADYADPYSFLQLLHSESPSNLTGYKNDEVDRLLDAAVTEFSATDRMALLEGAESRAMEDFPVIPIYFFVAKHLVRDGIIGWEDSILDIHPSQDLVRIQRDPT